MHITQSDTEKTIIIKYPEISEKQSAFMKLPAINRNESGVTAHLAVDVKPGEGLILVNINNVLANEDTQHSARMAAYVAESETGIDLSGLDIIYNLLANASMLEGPSAGAAMTITTIAALQNKKINQSVMITGTINHDGTIGPSGNVFAKAKAAKKSGARLFLVPIGESENKEYIETEFCKKYGIFEYCQPEFTTKKISIEKEAEIGVKEVGDISEALEYFVY